MGSCELDDDLEELITDPATVLALCERISPSAAVHALTQVSAAQITPLVIGRHFRPSYGENPTMYRRLSDMEFDVERCGGCAGVVFTPSLRPDQQNLDMS